jgi:cytochrome oxidase assembly protein ShyY1
MIVALISFGVWQMQRGEWKTAIIAERAAKLSQKPMVLNGLPDGPVSNLYYRGAYVTAPVKIARPYYTFSHTPDHGIGFQLYFPETWNNDRWFIRKSDFLTMEEWKSGSFRWPTNEQLAVEPPHEQLGLFLPLEDAENLILLKEMGSEPIRPLDKVEPVVFMPIFEWGSVQHELIKSRLLNITNNHATYTFIWFSLAIALFVIYVSKHTKITFKE